MSGWRKIRDENSDSLMTCALSYRYLFQQKRTLFFSQIRPVSQLSNFSPTNTVNNASKKNLLLKTLFYLLCLVDGKIRWN